jgi:transcriptional regulator with XRE-family HTH domain
VCYKVTPSGCTVTSVSNQQVPTAFNRRVGANLQKLRKATGMSQEGLARELARHDLPFRQQTVLKVEGGSRPLKFEEAATIALILGLGNTDVLFEYSEDEEYAEAAAQLEEALAGIENCRRRLEEEIAQYTMQRFDAENRLKRLAESREAADVWG